jgi:hypothetical protein
LHSHFPKQILINNRVFGWSATLDPDTQNDPVMTGNNLSLDCVTFYKDFLKANDKLIEDFTNPNLEEELVTNFNKAFRKMYDPAYVNREYIEKSDIDFLLNNNIN